MSEDIHSLKERLAVLEANWRQGGKVISAPPETPVNPSLQDCNKRHDEAMAEIKAEKKSAENLAIDAIKKTFTGTRHAKAEHRAQKNLSSAATERATKK